MIQKLVERNCQAIFKYPAVYLSILLILTGIASYYYATLPTETSVESLIIENDEDLVFYEKFKEQFGEDEFLVVGIPADDVFDQEILKFISAQTEKLETLDEVKEVVSLSNVDDFIGSDSDFIVQPLLESIPKTRQEKEHLRKRALANSLIGENLLNTSSSATLIFIRPDSRPDDPQYDERLVSKVEQIFEFSTPPWPGYEHHIAGWLATDVNLSRSMTRDMMVFMPLTYLLLVVLISLALKNRWAVILAITNVSICLIWTLALLNMIGGAMSPITSILPPLMMALAVSDSIHIFVEFLKQDRQKNTIYDAIRTTVKNLAMPCFLTSFTTAIGFISLAVSDVPPIRNFGIAAAGGMMAEFALSMTIIPLGLYFLRNKSALQQPSVTDTSFFHNRLSRFAQALPNYRRQLLWGSAALIVISLYLTTQIKVETNLLEYFKHSSPVRQASDFIDQQLGGVETFEISLNAEREDFFLLPENLQLVEKIENYLEKQGIVTDVMSINDLFREMNKAFHNENQNWYKLPDSREMAAQYLLLYDGDDLDYLLDNARQWTRISARITEHNSSKVAVYIDELAGFLQDATEEKKIEAQVTGKTLIANKLIDFIVNSQVQSLSLAFLLIFLLMLRIFKSWKLGIISSIPNMLPILLNFAVMGLFGVPLNSATAIIAAVAIGIAVDDTIHFICQYQQNRQKGKMAANAVQNAIVTKGTPIIMTSLIMTGGFGILLFGSFVPTIQFGILSALIMLFAVISDLLVLPALLLKFDAN
ncbi:hypothetical protein SAMN02745165_02698 [Malonomonas rubra DSM 5091]|uniref:SSD domain-containing protein n=1 Tax=Malonomonas rubra DSM 5091 TaxID=1122189 RepID=A0A1M6KFF4_MALRU|nr:MMPL family transporter [Malonomonas rubra]SHJ57676.1 hypothetical protein SAMN02745165_02698 [Malonomonas rubra DSM 5091]